jgi:hypothetical protein
MKLRANHTLFFILALAIYALVYWGGVSTVPFHPDESSYLFMSSELKTVLTNPSSMYWIARITSEDAGKRQWLRLLDPPLAHIAAELGRSAAGLPPLPRDWDWGETWDYNQRAGVVPSAELLQAGRMAVAALFPFSLAFFFFAARRAAGPFTAWAAVILMAANALLLLHTRRVMAEGILIFAIAFFLWTLLAAHKHPWLAAIPAALAFLAKQSLAPLALVGLLGVLWPAQPGRGWGVRARQALLFVVIYAALIFAFYPIAWRQPLRVLADMAEKRQYLAEIQLDKYGNAAISSLGERAAAMARQVYFAAPTFYEDPKYKDVTRASEAAYLANPLHALLRSAPGGGLLLALTLVGMACFGWQVRRRPSPAQRAPALLWITFLLQAVALLAAVPLEWQRYYLPLIPLVCFWAAAGLDVFRRWIAARER